MQVQFPRPPDAAVLFSLATLFGMLLPAHVGRTALFDEESSSSAVEDMDKFFGHLLQKDSHEPVWARAIVEHSRDDAAQVGPEVSSAMHSSSTSQSSRASAWMRVHKEAMAAHRRHALFNQIAQASNQVLRAAKDFTLTPAQRLHVHAAAAARKAPVLTAAEREKKRNLQILQRDCAALEPSACRVLAHQAQRSVQARTHAWLLAAHRTRVASASSSTTHLSSASKFAGGSQWASPLPVGKRQLQREGEQSTGAARMRLEHLYQKQASLAESSAILENDQADIQLALATVEEKKNEECLKGSISACESVAADHAHQRESDGSKSSEKTDLGSLPVNGGSGIESERMIKEDGKIIDGIMGCVEGMNPEVCASAREAARMQEKINALKALKREDMALGKRQGQASDKRHEATRHRGRTSIARSFRPFPVPPQSAGHGVATVPTKSSSPGVGGWWKILVNQLGL